MKVLVTGAAGFANILEGCRQSKVKHLVFASSSSVYGANTKLPFSEQDNVDHPAFTGIFQHLMRGQCLIKAF